MMLTGHFLNMYEALEKACPKKKKTTKDENNPWWYKQLQDHRIIINRLYRARNKSENAKKEYKMKKLTEKHATKPDTDWKYIVETQSSTESIDKLRNFLEANSKHSLGVLEKDDGSFTEPGNNTLDHMLKSHFPAIEKTKET